MEKGKLQKTLGIQGGGEYSASKKMQPDITANCIIDQLVYCVDVMLCLVYRYQINMHAFQYQQRLRICLKLHENSQSQLLKKHY